MAGKKISELDAITSGTLAGGDYLPVVDVSEGSTGTTKRTTVTDLTAKVDALGSSGGLNFTIDTSSTTMADPGPGLIRFNNATLASATAIAIAAESASSGNPDVTDITSGWDGGTLELVKQGSPEVRLQFTISAAADNTGWVQYTVFGGVAVGSFANVDSALLFYVADASAPAAASATAAAASATLASQWATEDEDVVVSGGEYSAKHYSAKSADSATAAAASATAAATAEAGSETAQAAAEAALASTQLAAAAAGAYGDTTLAAAQSTAEGALSVGDTYYATGDDVSYVGLYLIETGPVSTELAQIPTAANYAQLQFDTWKLERIAKGDWWAKQRLPDFLVDVSYGDGRAYTVSGGTVSELINLADGTSIPASHATLRATETTVDGFAALQFGGGATTRPYIGNAVLPDLAGGLSFHCVVSLDTAATTNRLITVGDQAVAVGSKRIEYRVNSTLQNAIGFIAPSITTVSDASVANAISNGDLVLVSTYVDFVNGEVTHWFGGAVSGFAKDTFDASDFVGTSWDKLTIGGYDTTTTHVLTGALLVASQYSGATHTIDEAYNIHADLLEVYFPGNFEYAVSAIWLSQSNGDGNQADISGDMPTGNEVSFTDNTTYRWNSSTFKFDTTSIAQPAYPSARCNNPLYWFLQELMVLTAADGLTIKPVFNVVTSGGVPYTSSSLWTSGSSFLGPMDEEGAGNGKNSTFDTQSSTSWILMRDTITYTPKWRDRVLMRAFVIQGFESDAGVQVPYRKALQTLDGLAQAAERELGIDTFLVIELGSQGDTTEGASQAVDPYFEAIREAQRDFVASRQNAFMIYDHCKENQAEYGGGTFAADNLVVDGDGAWVSGAGYNGGVHYTPAQYRAIGITGARNFYRSARSRFQNYRTNLIARKKPILEDY